MGRTATILDLLTGGTVRLTRAELRVARALMANYPAAGLDTVAHLAGLAQVSDPTVVRLVSKLGFDGFGSFQRLLLREVEERMSSPLYMLESRRPDLQRGHVYGTFMASAGAALNASLRLVLPADFDAVIALVMDPRRRVLCVGGRFSRYLAAILRGHLLHFRQDTEVVDGTASDMADRLVDVGHRDVVVAFDYRRYQTDIIDFAREAREAGATVVLFTDPWKSPIASFAHIVIVAPVEVVSPYDTMVPALAQVEAIVAGAVARSDRRSAARLRRLERLRARHGITVDARRPGPTEPGHRGTRTRPTRHGAKRP